MSQNKNLCIFDNNIESYDKVSLKGTSIILKETGTGKPLFRGSNKVIVSGSEFNAIKDFDFSGNFGTASSFLSTIPSYDTALAESDASTISHALDTPTGKKPITSGLLSGLGNFTPGTDAEKTALYEYFTRRTFLFCVGIDGCGIENSRVFKVRNTKWIAPYTYSAYDPGTGVIDTSVTNCLIPFKMRPSNSDITTADRQIYFGRSTVTEGSNTMISYYFKAFDQTPTLIRRYADDSAELSNVDNVWKNTRLSDAEIVVQLKMSVNTTDCREYFNSITGTNTSRINTISLCTAVPYLDENDQLFYQDIRPFTKFNFPNESLIDTSKGVDITYYLYY